MNRHGVWVEGAWAGNVVRACGFCGPGRRNQHLYQQQFCGREVCFSLVSSGEVLLRFGRPFAQLHCPAALWPYCESVLMEEIAVAGSSTT
ncbi:unnamed protein product [Gongylonema pulchrum]|uniref:Uncharacterized protein n=1 Tax=Gongylonema pulchrum TaxID=637853 RepID=A0A3P6UCW7_9BILA|nr:unnamed protein product [Gongylonema pulchrum]